MTDHEHQPEPAGGLSAVERSVRAWLEAQRVNGGPHGLECVGVEKLTKFAEAMIIQEREACAEIARIALRHYTAASTGVPYAILKRSNEPASGGGVQPLPLQAPVGREEV